MYSGGVRRPDSQSSIVRTGIPVCFENSVLFSPTLSRSSLIDLVAQPIVKLPTAENLGLTPDKEELLSKIIAEINSRTGKSYDNDVAVKAMLQIRDIMMKSEKLRTSAKSNTLKDFEFEYYDGIDEALIKGLSENKDFFSLLLNNEDIKKDVLGIFSEEIYNSLRTTKK